MGNRRALAVAMVLVVAAAGPVAAADFLIGHKVSKSKYGGNPPSGRLFKMVAKAGKDGNPAAFVLPAMPAGTASAVVVRDGGSLVDPLSGGEWKGLGNPAGSKGWKYKNKNAPATGAVRLLIFKEKVIKLVAKSTGSMPPPAASNGDVAISVAINGDRYCAEAIAPHQKEIAGKIILAKAQQPPAECSITCPFGNDSDGDRLDDCVETNTGVFVDSLDTGTDPNLADTDDDGIGDGDEVLGTTGGLDLPGLGVNPLRRDILIEYDWFDDGLECGMHSHQPTNASLDMVTAMFAAAPLVNPDGTTGINFIHDIGQGGLFDGGNFINDADGVLVGGVSNSEFQTYKSANFASNRLGYFHYTILPHRYDTNSSSSGQAEIFGDDMIVSLYCANSNRNVAHTIAHELGHNLFLFHGGNDNCNYKPNYNSVMNYRYQFPGIDDDCTPPGNNVLDYSIGDRIDLDENDLDEAEGTCGVPFAWDWNGNTAIENSIVFDINSADADQAIFCAGTLSVLRDSNDWGRVRLDVLPAPAGAGAAPRSASVTIDCHNPAPVN